MKQDPQHDIISDRQQVGPAASGDSERRRALLRGLGKTAAVLGAASPVYSYAARNVLTPTGTQCTVSGNQSAAVSQTGVAATNCAGFAPSYFFTATTLDISAGAGVVAAALGITSQEANALKNTGTTGSPVVLSASNGCIYIGVAGGATCTKVAPNHWPTSGGPGTLATFSTVFGGGSSRTLLEALYSAAGNVDEKWFIAAYLSALLSNPPTNTGDTTYVVPGPIVHVPFTAAEVVTSYTAKYADALALYKLVCVAKL